MSDDTWPDGEPVTPWADPQTVPVLRPTYQPMDLDVRLPEGLLHVHREFTVRRDPAGAEILLHETLLTLDGRVIDNDEFNALYDRVMARRKAAEDA